MQSTSIRVQTTTRERLLRLKKDPRESFDSVISRLLDTIADDMPPGDEAVETIEPSLKEYHEGVYYTYEEILAELNLAVDRDTSEIVEISDVSLR